MNKKTKNLSTGQWVMTRGVNDLIAEDAGFAKFVMQSVNRYKRQDWGEMTTEDKKQNDDAVAGEFNRIFAAYENQNSPAWKIWIITEADRRYTTILFPSEY